MPASLPASSPASRPASLPPSPQGLPVCTNPSVRYSGAATVPDPSEIEAMPAKGRKRKASYSGKENSKEHAPKHAKTTAAGPSRKRKAEAAVDGPNKHQCTAGGHSFAVAVPNGWASNALEMLTSEDLGPQWHLLLEAWLIFEKERSFNEKAKPWLSSLERPDVVGQWIKQGRCVTWRPDAGGFENFKSEFNSWWRSLQPTWRVEGGAGLKRDASNNWDRLRCSGINGVLSAIAALFFWAHAGFDNAPSPAWDAAVSDVLYALGMLSRTA